MKTKQIPHVLGFFVLIISLVGFPSGIHAQTKPNVVILYTDDQGTLDANSYGATDLYTPNIDRLAKAGVRFTQAYAHTVCCPSRAALMTGRHPQRANVNAWTQGDMKGPDGVNMNLSEITLAEALKTNGYQSAIFGKWHLGAHRDHGPMKQGFDEFFGVRDGFIDNYNHYFLHGKGYHDLYEGTQEVYAPGQYFPQMMTDRAIQFIDKNQTNPFLLYVPFNIPHYPEQSLAQHAARYKDMPMPRQSYATAVTTTDYFMGLILDKLDALNLTKNTIVIYMSDNGHSEENASIRVDNHKSGYPKGHYYGAHLGGGYTGKWIGHKGEFLEGGVRVPAIISYPPKIPQGQVRDQAITAMDWFPTILDLTGTATPANKLDGQSVLPIINNPKAPSAHETIYFQWFNNWAVRQGDWKLLCKQGNGKDAKPSYSLYNLAEDKPEQKNHLKARPQIYAKLKALHEEWAKDVFSK